MTEKEHIVSRRPFFVGLLFVALAVGSVIGTARLLHTDPEHVRPPHTERPTAGAPGLPAVGGEAIDLTPFTAAYAAQINEAIYAAAAVEETERLEAARRAQYQPRTRGGGGAGCEGVDWVIPVGIVWGESRCDFGAVNQTGCYDARTGITWTCIGAYQFDRRHWLADQWGACADLDPAKPEDQHECARRVSGDGSNLAPWGG